MDDLVIKVRRRFPGVCARVVAGSMSLDIPRRRTVPWSGAPPQTNFVLPGTLVPCTGTDAMRDAPGIIQLSMISDHETGRWHSSHIGIR